jgi:hypothetical protein
MRRLGFAMGLVVLVSVSVPALSSAGGNSGGSYSFQTIIFAGDTFTQLLGINQNQEIAGYHGATINKGFTLVPPSSFTDENFPGSA